MHAGEKVVSNVLLCPTWLEPKPVIRQENKTLPTSHHYPIFLWMILKVGMVLPEVIIYVIYIQPQTLKQ